MIKHELLLLGLLKESPKHGYDIKIKIKKIFSLFAGVDLKSIYYPLKVLERKGLIEKRINRLGKRPERFVYKLTSRGEARFEELLTKSLLDFKRPQFSLDLSLYFLHYLKPGIAKRRLRGRTLVLKNLARSLRRTVNSLKNKKPLSLVHILEHDLQMVETECKFLANLIKTL
jgi:DNA-binding PadR family transcriptional regulator